MKHFIDIIDFSKKDILQLIKQALKMKQNPFDYNFLNNKNVGLIFEKPSTRTRVSFEVGIQQLGGHAIVLKKDEIGLGDREPVKDVSRVLSRYLDLVMIRTFEHSHLKEFVEYSSIPVINGLTDYSHPCQAIADFLTLYEHFSSFEGIKICYLGDGNNVSRSLVEISAICGVDCVISSPSENKLNSAINFKYEKDPKKAIAGAHVVYTDTWVSMGDSAKSLEHFEQYQVNQALLSLADPKAIFLHCLPAHRGEEVTNDVIESTQSKVFDQAENRLHAQKAIMKFLLEN
tara:strand:- start:1442 stop:2305 length:864 start_codon:yes stop_codon:yes gene_type:complete